jgi:hypothetical protein
MHYMDGVAVEYCTISHGLVMGREPKSPSAVAMTNFQKALKPSESWQSPGQGPNVDVLAVEDDSLSRFAKPSHVQVAP